MKPLPDGGTVGVAAVASPYDMRSELDRGTEWWESHGYRVKLAPGVHERDDYVAGDPRKRAEDLHALFADPEVDVVQSLQGGFGSSELIPHLDFDLIGRNPKPFVGYSDITVAPRPAPAARRVPHVLRPRIDGRRRQRDDEVHAGAPAEGASRRGDRRGAARPRRSVRPRDRAAAASPHRSSAAASGC